MPSILIVEDDAILRNTLAGLFAKKGYQVVETGEYDEAVEYLGSDIFDLILSDLHIGPDSGFDILTTSKRLHPGSEVIIMSTIDSIQSAVEAIENGASDYIIKPFKNEELLFKADRAMERIGFRNEIRYLRQEVAHHFGFDNIIGSSKAIDDIKKTISRIAAADISVLITGKPGTGKELFAKVIHHHSPRRKNSFVPVNCSAMPENLLESEFFGHVKGAFTPAAASKRGLLEEANHGTIFLDEVGDLPISIQAKLLRVLQEQEIRPAGGNRARTIDVRIIAATNVDLNRKVANGEFREDLYYRLNVMPIHIPPLNERHEDIPALAEYFLRRIQKEHDYSTITLSADGLELLLKHNWPGNVRELENTLKRAAALSGGCQIRYEDIVFISPGETQLTPQPGTQFCRRSLIENQKIQILKTLEENDWNYSLTAGQLGIGRTTLWRKIKKFNLKQSAMAVK